jgi:hypothetical protein
MRPGDVHRIGCLGAANLYEGRAHFGIEATNPAPFKPYPINADEVLATHRGRNGARANR